MIGDGDCPIRTVVSFIGGREVLRIYGMSSCYEYCESSERDRFLLFHINLTCLFQCCNMFMDSLSSTRLGYLR